MLPIPEFIGEYFRYDPETGNLYRTKQSNSHGILGLARTKSSRWGHMQFYFRGHGYQVHRVAWFLMTGEQPPRIIDHKDLAPSNNRWDNLRAATPTLNNANRPRRGRFLKGCSTCGRKFKAQIKFGGKSQHLGVFDTEEEAHAAYVAKAVELFGEFARAA